jgi:hypothetical protein
MAAAAVRMHVANTEEKQQVEVIAPGSSCLQRQVCPESALAAKSCRRAPSLNRYWLNAPT